MLSLSAFIGSIAMVQAQKELEGNGEMLVGVARIDITPQTSIRLSGYAARGANETDKVIHRLEAKALAFGSDIQEPSILLTVDLVGIPKHFTDNLVDALAKEINIDASRVAICASHTHGGPEVGNLLNILQARKNGFTEDLLSLAHLEHLALYTEELKQKLKQVAFDALKNRKPSMVSWGQGKVGFAKNRRTEGGPVDHALPLLRVENTKGELQAVFVSYACHATTIGSVNEIYGDWISEAKITLEKRHPGAVAMVAIGCGGDSNPSPRGEMEQMRAYGKQIADEAERLLKQQLVPITEPPKGKFKIVELPFKHIPSISELTMQSKENSIKGYYSRLALYKALQGEVIPSKIKYPIQVWTFGTQMVMVNLPGEVVVDYSLRLKKEFGSETIWVNAYSNAAPSYIASKRVIEEGGYEAEDSMYWYNKPSPYKPEIEDIIIEAVESLIEN